MKLIFKWNSALTNGSAFNKILHRVLHTALIANKAWFAQVKNDEITQDIYNSVYENMYCAIMGIDISDFEFVPGDPDIISIIKKYDHEAFNLQGTGERYNPASPDTRYCKTNEAIASILFSLGIGELPELGPLKKDRNGDYVATPESTSFKINTDILSELSCSFEELPNIILGTSPYESLIINRSNGSVEEYYLAASHVTKVEKAEPPVKPPPAAMSIILFGPPGTGKSRLAKRMAAHLAGISAPDARKRWPSDLIDRFHQSVKVIQFHASMSYEDFVEGLKPISMRDGTIKYEIIPGPLMVQITKASSSLYASIPSFFHEGTWYPCEDVWRLFDLDKEAVPTIKLKDGSTLSAVDFERPIPAGAIYKKLSVRCTSWTKADGSQYVLLIDEINRGKVAQIFGELLFMIADRTDIELPVQVHTQYSRTPLSWPDNLSIVGTMNHSDRSVEDLDQALKRRFEFKLVATDYAALQTEVLERWRAKFGGSPIEWLKEVNNRISIVKESIDYQIGHSYFFKPVVEPNTEAALRKLISVFYLEILPTIESMVFRDPGDMKRILGDRLYGAVYGNTSGFLPPYLPAVQNALSKVGEPNSSEHLTILAASLVLEGLVADEKLHQFRNAA